LLLVYSFGLQLGQLVKLRPVEVQIEQKRLFVHAGEGKQDRYMLLSDPAIRQLWAYQYLYQRVAWLFGGQTGGPYSPGSVRSFFRRAGVYPYRIVLTPRRSFATHVLEREMDLRYMQKWLGRSSPEPTQNYPLSRPRSVTSLCPFWISGKLGGEFNEET